MTQPRLGLPDLGVGAGLRVPHYAYVFEHQPKLGFFEVISENFMGEGGKPLRHLDRVLSRYPVVQHGVSLNLGGPGPLDFEYLNGLRRLVQRVRPPWVSDHLCWCGTAGAHLHDLLPLPRTREMVARLVERARLVQDYLGVRFVLENVSSYLQYNADEMPEWEFVSEVIERADVGLLLDVNNVYVSAQNHDFDPDVYIAQLPHRRVVQVHLAGHTDVGRYVIDTHRGHVADPVWALYRRLLDYTGKVSTVLEWDDQIPAFPVLLAELERAEAIRAGLPPEPSAATSGVDDHVPAGPWLQGGSRELARDEDV